MIVLSKREKETLYEISKWLSTGSLKRELS